MKTFYIFYSWNSDNKAMAISTSTSQQKAAENFRERINEKVKDKDDETISYHVWWIEELILSDKEEVIIA